MRLEPLTLEQCEEVRQWRNDEPQFLRTPYMLTEEMQEDFYHGVVCNRDSKHRYFALDNGIGIFVGMGGLTNIEWENSTAEISLIISPSFRGYRYGSEAVNDLLKHAFDDLGLMTVYGEVYECGNVGFWNRMVERYHGYKTRLPNRKMYRGILHDSMWFQFSSGCLLPQDLTV